MRVKYKANFAVLPTIHSPPKSVATVVQTALQPKDSTMKNLNTPGLGKTPGLVTPGLIEPGLISPGLVTR
jgi:GLTT repeat (6 copies)